PAGGRDDGHLPPLGRPPLGVRPGVPLPRPQSGLTGLATIFRGILAGRPAGRRRMVRRARHTIPFGSPAMSEREIFLNALDRSDPADRAAYLERACGADAELRRRIEALLAAHEAAGGFLRTPAPAVDAPGGIVAPGPTT